MCDRRVSSYLKREYQKKQYFICKYIFCEKRGSPQKMTQPMLMDATLSKRIIVQSHMICCVSFMDRFHSNLSFMTSFVDGVVCKQWCKIRWPTRVTAHIHVILSRAVARNGSVWGCWY